MKNLRRKIISLYLLLAICSSILCGCEKNPHKCPFPDKEYYHVCLRTSAPIYKTYYVVISVEDYKKWLNDENEKITLYSCCSLNHTIQETFKEKIPIIFVSEIEIYDIDNLPWGCFE